MGLLSLHTGLSTLFLCHSTDHGHCCRWPRPATNTVHSHRRTLPVSPETSRSRPVFNPPNQSPLPVSRLSNAQQARNTILLIPALAPSVHILISPLPSTTAMPGDQGDHHATTPTPHCKQLLRCSWTASPPPKGCFTPPSRFGKTLPL